MAPSPWSPARRPLRATVVAAVATLGLLVAGAPAEGRSLPGTRAVTRPPVTGVYQLSSADARIASMLAARATTATFGTSFSGVVLDAASQRVVWEKNARTALKPASTTKLATASDALTVFGPDTRFTTKIVQGTASNRVVVVGSGDPGLSSSQLDAMAKKVASTLRGRGITTARVYIDDDVFPTTFTRATGWLSSYVPADFTPLHGLVRDQRDVADTGTDVGTYVRDRLKAYGVSAGYYGRTNSSSRAAVLATSSGPTVSASIGRMLLNSDNEIAEAFHRLVGIARKKGNTWAAARAAQSEVLFQQDLYITALYDGSGLSRSDRLSAIQLARILDRAVDPQRAELWPLRSAASIPTAGRTGTLQAKYGRFSTSPSSCAAGRLWAKTGTLSDVVALAGFTTGTDGRVKTFAFLVNGKSSSLALKQSVDALAATVTGCY
jgi:D-alanyl-D-alanine carboxypeptidase/D-alanyl-D-alanine-endopeptidase (penicillin-binding protein 4)